MLGRRLVRLQCYEGLDVASAVYEWNYPRQMIRIRLAEMAGRDDRAGRGDRTGDGDEAARIIDEIKRELQASAAG